MKKLLLFIITLGPVLVYAQPGYLGKRLSLGYEFEATPIIAALYDYNYFGESGSGTPPDIFFQTGHGFTIGYANTRKMEFFASYSMRNVTCYMATADYETSPSPREMMAHQNTMEIGFRRYLKDFVAPVGSYYKMSLGYVSLKYDKDEKSIDFRNSDLEIPTLENNFPEVQIPQFSFGFGVKKPLSKRIYIQFDAQMNFLLTSLDYKQYMYTQFSKSSYFEECLQRSFNMVKRFNTRIGIGIYL